VAKIAAKNAEQPEVMFTLEMREKMHGVWRRRAGTWVSTTASTIDLTQAEYETLNRCIATLRAPKKASQNRLRKVLSEARESNPEAAHAS
jgi:hypothetical protein